MITTLNVLTETTRIMVEGGLPGMSVITIIFVVMLFAAWKAPSWVKEMGLAALMAGIFWFMYGLYQAFEAVSFAGDISLTVMCGGLKVASLAPQYGMAVYLVSLIIRIIQTPKRDESLEIRA